ncbi:PadR family transcriptional regulator [Streptomyces sp. NPDC059851]|uniref:PadR family transcriptional regulator n=1 Tax=Streptomyces sp. NPDC059851 TaxID=3346971 RepID=UPI003650E20A
MKNPFRITSATLDVMEAFLVADDDLHGFAVARAAGKPTGSIYPILARMEEAGWLESRWESEHPDPGRPRRRFYKLTPDGMASARAVVLERRGQLPTPTPAVGQPPRPAFGFTFRWEAAR